MLTVSSAQARETSRVLRGGFPISQLHAILLIKYIYKKKGITLTLLPTHRTGTPYFFFRHGSPTRGLINIHSRRQIISYVPAE